MSVVRSPWWDARIGTYSGFKVRGLEVGFQGAMRAGGTQRGVLVEDTGPYKHRLSGFRHPSSH